MQSSVQSLEALKREITITVPVEDVQVAYKARLKEVAKNVKINGFRPGKVPADVVEQRYSKAVLDEVANQLIQSSFVKAIEENALKVAGQPMVTDMQIAKAQPFTFKAEFEVYPEIALNLLDGVEITRESSEVTDQDIEKMLKNIQQQHAEFAIVERAAADKDRVTIDFEGTIDGDLFDGGSAKEHILVLGSGSMIPGFEEGIVGMAIGETKDIELTFPETYHAENLKGKAAVFKVVLHKVEAPELPPVDDLLAEKMDVEGGVAALKTKLREGMSRELADRLSARLKEQVLDSLIERNEIEIPAVLVKSEAQHLQKMTMARMAQQYGMSAEQMEKLNLPLDPYMSQADKRVRLGLLLAEVIKKFDIKTDSERLNAKVKEIASHYQTPEEVERWYLSNKEALSEVEAALIEETAVEKLLESAKVSDKVVAYSDIVEDSASA